MTEQVIIQILTELPLVAAFMWFVLTWSDRMENKQQERDEQWRDFLGAQRTMTVTALQNVSDDLQTLSASIDEVRLVVKTHDSAIRQAILPQTGPLPKINASP